MRLTKNVNSLNYGGNKADYLRVDIKSGPGPEHGVKTLRRMVVDVEYGFIYNVVSLRMYALIS